MRTANSNLQPFLSKARVEKLSAPRWSVNGPSNRSAVSSCESLRAEMCSWFKAKGLEAHLQPSRAPAGLTLAKVSFLHL